MSQSERFAGATPRGPRPGRDRPGGRGAPRPRDAGREPVPSGNRLTDHGILGADAPRLIRDGGTRDRGHDHDNGNGEGHARGPRARVRVDPWEVVIDGAVVDSIGRRRDTRTSGRAGAPLVARAGRGILASPERSFEARRRTDRRVLVPDPSAASVHRPALDLLADRQPVHAPAPGSPSRPTRTTSPKSMARRARPARPLRTRTIAPTSGVGATAEPIAAAAAAAAAGGADADGAGAAKATVRSTRRASRARPSTRTARPSSPWTG